MNTFGSYFENVKLKDRFDNSSGLTNYDFPKDSGARIYRATSVDG